MNLEERIRHAFDEEAAQAPLAGAGAGDLRRRVRRRQAVTVLGGITTVALVIAIGVGAILAVRPGTKIPADDDGAPRAELTATIEGFTVTVPSDWYVVDYWPTRVPESEAFPVFQVTNFDPGLGANLCAGGGGALPPGGLALVVGTLAEDGPQEPCGSGHYSYLDVERGNVVVHYVIWSTLTDGAQTESDIETLDAIRAGLAGNSLDGGPRLSGPRFGGPRYILAGWPLGDTTSMLVVKPDGGGIELRVLGMNADGTYSDGGCGLFGIPALEAPLEGCAFFGVVTTEAVAVEYRPYDSQEILSATILPVPPSLGFNGNVYAFLDDRFPTKDEPGPGPGEIVAVGADGSVLGPEPTPYRPPSTAPPGPPSDELTVITHDISLDAGEYRLLAGTTWSLTLDNRDEGIPHNVAIYDGRRLVWQSNIIVGVRKVRVTDIPALPAGTYEIRCEVHPTTEVAALIVG